MVIYFFVLFQAEQDAEERKKQLEHDSSVVNVRSDFDDNYMNEADIFDGQGRQQM